MESTRVTRSIRAGAPGTLRQWLRHGASLVCVRYRENDAGTVRYTTIELIVDRRPARADTVRIKLDWREHELRQLLKAAGARWNTPQRSWLLPWKKAQQLGLLARAEAVLGSTRQARHLPRP